MAAAEDAPSSLRARAATGLLGSEVAVLGGATAGVAALYWLLHAPQLNPPTYLDPWFYTGFFRNFGYMYRAFENTYYASRLPWIIPGRIANGVFPAQTAALVLHAVFFLAAAIAAYVVVRRFFGRRAGLVAYAALATNLVFYDAFTNDYPDGAQIAYLLLALAFLLRPRPARPIHLAAGGFFAMAAIGTNLFDVVLVAPMAPAYAIVAAPGRHDLRAAAADLAAFVAGAAALVVLVGSYAVSYGGEFLFFMPSVRALDTIKPDVGNPGHSWMLSEPRLLIPVFCVLLAVTVLLASRPRRRRSAAGPRFVVGAAAYLAATTLVVYVWELAFGGASLDVPYYFSLFSPGIAVTLGGSVGLLMDEQVETSRPYLVTAAALVGAALPAVVAYSAEPSAMFARRGTVLAIVLMVGALGAAALLPLSRRSRGPIGLLAVVLALAGPACAAAGSADTRGVFGAASGSYSSRVRVLTLADGLISFVRDNHLQALTGGATPPAFWYDASADPDLTGMQASYLWGWTWVGLSMPKVDPGMRRLIGERRPRTIVLLCTRPGCSGGPDALRRAGVKLRPAAATVLSAGGHRVWVRAFTLPRYAVSVEQRFYDQAAPLSGRGFGGAIRSWAFVGGAPSDWQVQAAAVERAAGAARVRTTPKKLGYQLEGATTTLPAGTYHAVVSGRVETGGALLGVLDAARDSWLAQAGFAAGERWLDGRTMSVEFTLQRPTDVRVVLSNWAPSDRRSIWLVRRVALVRG